MIDTVDRFVAEPTAPIIEGDAEPDVIWGSGGIDDWGWSSPDADEPELVATS